MERKHTPSYSIKGKLISAVCMLLVAVIMVVSSTYAWFTLSTAPEVKGISTAIGANGALDIRLYTAEEPNEADKNTTWGNLVNLTNGYGFDKIVLLPAGLVLTPDGHIASSFLGGTDYGEDGRPKKNISTNGLTGTLDSNSGSSFVVNDNTGVRAVGASSGLSARQLAFNTAKNAANDEIRLATKTVRDSLGSEGSVLANIVIKVAQIAQAERDNMPITAKEYKALATLLEDLEDTIAHIEAAYKQQILALSASKLAEAETAAGSIENADLFYDVVEEQIANITLDTILEDQAITVTVPGIGEKTISLENNASGLLTGIEKLADTKTKVQNATLPTVEGIDSMEDGASATTWGAISSVMNSLINSEYVTVNGYTPAAIMADITAFAQDYMNKQSLTVSLSNGAGVYEEIADQCGNYSASIKLNISYGSFNLQDVPATMSVQSNLPTAYAVAVSNLLKQNTMQPSKNMETGDATISEFYGFIIDFAFMTNAAESNLLLQVDAIDRIYSDNNNADTLGGGSYMTFSNVVSDEGTTSFSSDQIKELMKAVRIVFFAPADANNTASEEDESNVNSVNEILAYAKLDVENAVVDGSSVKAEMYLYKTVEVFTYEVAGESESTTVTVYAPAGTTTPATYYTDVDCTNVATIPANTNPTHKGSEAKFTGEAAVITSLAQNTQTRVSTLVYLDGENIENKDVAAVGTKSVDIDMNIQFSSSADLKPMEYGELHTPNQAAGN